MKLHFTEAELQDRLERGIERFNQCNDNSLLYWNGYSQAIKELLDLGRSRNAYAEPEAQP